MCSLRELTGRNKGAYGTAPDGRPIHMIGTAVWDVPEDGMLLRNRVHRTAHEVHRQFTSS